MRKRHGGIPLESLTPTRRRQLTSHAKGHATNAARPHQGSKEQQRRARQMAKLKGGEA